MVVLCGVVSCIVLCGVVGGDTKFQSLQLLAWPPPCPNKFTFVFELVQVVPVLCCGVCCVVVWGVVLCCSGTQNDGNGWYFK